MAARKLQQEIEKEFKKTDEGIALFDGIHEKLLSSQNASQKDKLEDALKKEIKKLQRSRDKIKGWHSQNDVKDKKPLHDKRRAIETVLLPSPPFHLVAIRVRHVIGLTTCAVHGEVQGGREGNENEAVLQRRTFSRD